MQPTMLHDAPRGDATLGRFGGGRVRNVLVVALDAAIPVELPHAGVLVVAPALDSRLRHWLSDEDAARREAAQRAIEWVDRLERHGVHAEGRVGDADPLLAIADALPTFPADEIVIAASSEHSSRLADGLVSRASDRFALPVSRAGRRDPGAAEAKDRRVSYPEALSRAMMRWEQVGCARPRNRAEQLRVLARASDVPADRRGGTRPLTMGDREQSGPIGARDR